MGGSIKYTVPYFTVTFLNYDDTVFETQQVAYGHDAVAPANNPTQTGYTFNGWENYTNITKDRQVKSKWIKNEAYLTTGSKWQAIVNASPVGSQTNIEQIEFVSSVPSGATLIGSVGVTNETATTVWTEGCGVFDVKAYYTALSTGKYKILFYSPYTIYAPEDSSYLFSNSTSANSLTNLTSITFGNFNTSNVTNMKGMFGGCRSLTLLNLSSFNTSKVTNMLWMFNNCSKLTSLILSNFNTSNVTNMSGMFSNCQVLTSLDVSNFNTSKVTNMSDMFSSCKALISLNVSSFETNKVTNMSYMFNGCSKLTSLILSNFNTSNVTSMSCMFYSCQALTSLDLSSFVTSKVINMYNMFYRCYSLTSLNLSSFDMSKVTNTTDMLAGRSSLTEIKTPKAIGSAAVDLPTKTNYSWFDQANTNNTYTQITSACLSKTLLLQGNKFTLTANANGGTIPTTTGWTVASGGATATKQVTYDSTYGTLPTPTRNGYTFAGWFSAQTGGSKVESSTTVKTASNHTIYAHWTANTYTVTANANGGTIPATTGWTVASGGATATKQVTYDSTYETLPTPTKTGYTFNGWIGKNLFNKDITPYKSNHYLRGADGVEVSYEAYHIYQIVVTPGLTLTIKNSGQSNAPGFAYYTANGTYISGQNYATNSTVTTTVPANASFLRFSVNHGESYRLDLHYFQIELGSSATSYEAYQVITSSTKVTRTSNHTLLASWTLNESYLLKAWQSVLIDSNANFTAANIKTIQFVNNVPSGSGYTQVSVGAKDSNGWSKYVVGTAGVSDITAYVKANSSDSTKYDVIFYSPVTIYAPVDSSYLFSKSTPANQLTNLTSITFGNFNTSNVTDMHYMFFNCKALTSLNLSNFNTSNVTDMRGMFNNCEALTSLNVSNFNTSKVTDMSWMFYYCHALTSLNLSNFNTSNVTTMSYMFHYCYSLTSLNVSNFNTSKVTDMYAMFWKCSSLTSLDLSSFDMSKVTNTDSMLANCSGLTEIKTPNAIGSAAVNLPTRTGYSWVDKNNTSIKYTQINSTNVGKTLILKEN